MKRMNPPTFRPSRSVVLLLGLLLLTGCRCLKSHEDSCVFSKYTPGLDETPMVGMAQLGILMRQSDGMVKSFKERAPAELLHEARQTREAVCSTEEFDKQVKIFNEVLNRRIEGYKKENEVYYHWLVPCVAPHAENRQTTNSNGAGK